MGLMIIILDFLKTQEIFYPFFGLFYPFLKFHVFSFLPPYPSNFPGKRQKSILRKNFNGFEGVMNLFENFLPNLVVRFLNLIMLGSFNLF